MTWLRKFGLIAAAALAVLALGGAIAGSASALVEPTTGQPGAGSPGQPVESNNHCGAVNPETGVSAVTAPGKAESAQSVFNGTGRSAEVYAGQELSASLANSNSTAAISQYDIACVQATRVAGK
jgi:hypothetical protein